MMAFEEQYQECLQLSHKNECKIVPVWRNNSNRFIKLWCFTFCMPPLY